MVKVFQRWDKVAKFRQIWSRWWKSTVAARCNSYWCGQPQNTDYRIPLSTKYEILPDICWPHNQGPLYSLSLIVTRATLEAIGAVFAYFYLLMPFYGLFLKYFIWEIKFKLLIEIILNGSHSSFYFKSSTFLTKVAKRLG